VLPPPLRLSLVIHRHHRRRCCFADRYLIQGWVLQQGQAGWRVLGVGCLV
jgi:hypothetical protein